MTKKAKFLWTSLTILCFTVVMALVTAARYLPNSFAPKETLTPASIEARLADSPAVQVAEIKTRYFINLNTVKKIACATIPADIKERNIAKLTATEMERVKVKVGTGTIISLNRVLTAHHVIAGASACIIDNNLAVVSYDSPENDLTVLTADLGSTPVTDIACDGFTPMRHYMMFGYAQGSDFAMDVGMFTGMFVDLPAYETAGEKNPAIMKHAAIFSGPITSGMSGGPVFGPDGRVYGILNASSDSLTLARQLTDTDLCAALKPPQKAPSQPAAVK